MKSLSPRFDHWRFVLLCLLAAWLAAIPARADILISPQRAILTDDNRQAVISLHNPGTTTRTYRLEWVERRLTEDGQLLSVKEGENPRSIANMVRFSPRRVVIKPGQTQTVRLDYRMPAGLAPGEYRSHLRIGLEPPTDGGGTEVMNGEREGITFRLNALMSFAVPIFVRHGAGTATAQITAVAPTLVKHEGEPDEPGLKVSLTRAGEFSSYGRLVVYQQLNAQAPVEQISETGGVAMYTEISNQTRIVALKPGTRLQPGSWLRVTYEGDGAERGQIYAERVFQIGN
jgi:fimbrial chaperone protein